MRSWALRAVTWARVPLLALAAQVAQPLWVKLAARQRTLRPTELWMFSAALVLLVFSAVKVWLLWPTPMNSDKLAQALLAKSATLTRPGSEPGTILEAPEKTATDGAATPTDLSIAVAPEAPVVVEPPKPDRLAEARALVESGDIEAARARLEPLAADNDPAALLMLGETFDPIMLTAWDAHGTTADADRARGFYKRALAQGEIKAQRRLEALE